MAATMKDIANKTGLGLATISKYLNGGSVREKNRLAIEKAIAELDFTVNEFARSLKTSKSKTIGVLIPELSNVFITSVITVLEDILRQNGYGIIVCDSRTDEERQKDAIEFLLSKMVDGIVMMPVGNDIKCLKPALDKKLPVVLVDRTIPSLENQVGEVMVDSRGIARECTLCFLERGHRKIGMIAGPREISTSLGRLSGYRSALEKAGVPYEEKLVVYGGYTMEGGHEAMNTLLDRNPELTGVFVSNYEMTVGAMLALNERGLQIPRELSLIGFDNFELARVVKPRLTIAEQPIEEIGRKAAQLLLEQLQEKKPPRRVVLDARLRLGDSVRRIL